MDKSVQGPHSLLALSLDDSMTIEMYLNNCCFIFFLLLLSHPSIPILIK